MSFAIDLLAVLAYALAASQVSPRAQTTKGQRQLMVLAAMAISLHAFGLPTVGQSGQISLGLAGALSLFLWQCAAVHLLTLLRFPLWQLAPAVWAMAGIGIILSWWLPAGSPTRVELDFALRVHIALSLFAYAVLTLAALQTVGYALRDRRLHRHRTKSQPTIPLQTMENLAFGLMSAGFVLLCLSIGTGFLFVDNFSAQHLVHKSVLSLIACAVFGGLLAGRQIWGWRGRTAIRWVLGGYASLILAYFGSKFVLEQMLGRSWS